MAPASPTRKASVVAEEVIQLAARFQSIIEMAEVLKGMSSVDNAVEERQQALVVAAADHEKVLKSIELAKRDREAVVRQIDGEREAHKRWLSDTETEMRTRARADSEKRAANVLAKANESADDIAMASKKTRDDADAALAEVSSHLKVVRAELALAISTTEALRTESADLSKKIADLRQAAKSIAA